MTAAKKRAPPKGRVKWDREMKESLKIMMIDEMSWPDIVATFNYLFREHLAECGLPSGTTCRTLKAQWNERNPRNKTQNADWAEIFSAQVSIEDAERQKCLQSRIREAADSLVIQTFSSMAVSCPRVRSVQPHNNSSSLNSAENSTPVKSSYFDRFVSDLSASSTQLHAAITQPRSVSYTNTKRIKLSSQIAGAGFGLDHSVGIQRGGSLRTPKKYHSVARSARPKVDNARRDGTVIRVSPKNLQQSTRRVEPVPEELAHPPQPGLLFRLWQERTPGGDQDSRNGFEARKYYRSNIVAGTPPKTSSDLDPTDLFNHLNRNEVPTPFISTSNRLCWIIQQALSLIRDGVTTVRLSVINPERLDKRTIFYAKPFHTALRTRMPFTGPRFMYQGTTEFLIWRSIPKEAIITTVSGRELLDLNRNAVLQQLLRFEILFGRNTPQNKRDLLKSHNILLNFDITGAIADLCLFLGLDAHARIEQISHVVADVLEGWSVFVEFKSPEEWLALATLFARKLCNGIRDVPLKEELRVKMGYLDGVRWGLGAFNAKHKQEAIKSTYRKAKRVGLGSPATLLTHELDAAKLEVLLYEKKQQHLIDGPASRAEGPGRKSRKVNEAIPIEDSDNTGTEEDDDDDDEGEEQEVFEEALSPRHRQQEFDEYEDIVYEASSDDEWVMR